VATRTAWTVLLAAADTSSEGPKCPSSRVLHGLGALAKPGAKRQTQAGVAGWPDFDPDFAEEPGLIEPYLSANQPGVRGTMGWLWGGYGEAPMRLRGDCLKAVVGAGDVGKASAGVACDSHKAPSTAAGIDYSRVEDLPGALRTTVTQNLICALPCIPVDSGCHRDRNCGIMAAAMEFAFPNGKTA